MRSLIILSSIVILTACGGGFDSLPDIPTAGTSLNSHVSTPAAESKWKYGTTDIDGDVFSRTATIYAINTYTVPKYPNLKRRSWVELEKRRMADNSISHRVVIFVPEAVKCTPSCDIKFKFNGQVATYRMQQSIEGVLTPINADYEKSLFNKFATSNRAVVSLPLVGLEKPFDSEFDLRGYDRDRMKFTEE